MSSGMYVQASLQVVEDVDDDVPSDEAGVDEEWLDRHGTQSRWLWIPSDSPRTPTSPGISKVLKMSAIGACALVMLAGVHTIADFAIFASAGKKADVHSLSMEEEAQKVKKKALNETKAEPKKRKVVERKHLPIVDRAAGLHSSWDGPMIRSMCKGREAEGLPKFDDDDEDFDEGKEAFGDAYESERSRRLKTAVVAVDGIRRFKLSKGGTMPYYGSADIQSKDPSAAEFAVFIFHGAVRDAINYFCAGEDIVHKQKKYPIDKVLLVVLKWHYQIDQPIETDVWWNGSKPWGSWMAGGHSDAKSAAQLSSFDVIDDFVVHLADNPKTYPKLKEILLMGHSAGGQTLHRYAFTTHLKPPHLSTKEDVKNRRGVRRDLDIRFVVANPSSYLYLDTNRWAYACGDANYEHRGCTKMVYRNYSFGEARKGWTVDFEYGDHGYRVTDGLGKKGDDVPFICRSSSFDHWFYGLNWDHFKTGFVIPYLREHPNITEAVYTYPERDVVYLVGQNDTCTDNEFPFCDTQCWTRKVSTATCYRNHMDMRCPAMLQGPNRKQRAIHYLAHLKNFYGEQVHNLFVVPGIGHQGGKIVTSEYGLHAIVGDLHKFQDEERKPKTVYPNNGKTVDAMVKTTPPPKKKPEPPVEMIFNLTDVPDLDKEQEQKVWNLVDSAKDFFGMATHVLGQTDRGHADNAKEVRE